MEPSESALSPTLESSEPKLPKAFAKAQGAFAVPKKTKQYLIQNKPVKYADLADVIDAVRTPLAENGFSVTHRMGYCRGPFGLTTVLMHDSGESLETWYPLPDASKIKAQDFGGTLTYARRYSLSSILGIASDEDTDGQGAADAGKQEQKQNVKSNQSSGPKAITPAVPPPKKDDPFPPDSPQTSPPDNVPTIDPNEYVIPFGPWKDKVLRKLDRKIVNGYLSTVIDTANAQGKEIKGDVLEFVTQAESYLAEVPQ